AIPYDICPRNAGPERVIERVKPLILVPFDVDTTDHDNLPLLPALIAGDVPPVSGPWGDVSSARRLPEGRARSASHAAMGNPRCSCPPPQVGGSTKSEVGEKCRRLSQARTSVHQSESALSARLADVVAMDPLRWVGDPAEAARSVTRTP